jgi:Uma2 family endonuclease
MNTTITQLLTDTWFTASWDEYIQTVEQPKYEKASCYYHQGKLRIEMSPLGNDHAKDHSIINYAIHLFAALKSIPLNGHDNCSYRQQGYQEAQPDLSFYIGDKVNLIPWGTTIINLEQYQPPSLVIEVANTSLDDDLGNKRILYEDLKVEEYWVIDVQNAQVIAFTIEQKNQGSYRIDESQVLPGLAISLLTQALARTRQIPHSEVSAWLLAQFQS